MFSSNFVLGWAVYGVLFLIDIVISVLIGSAARRKDRSFWSFFWLTLLITPLVTGLVVAAIPFRPEDVRHPGNKRN
jgi:hypothetical protein